ncbi:CYTH domain-containing protein [Arcobacter aquimarinus]|uniref:CYTH domain-containing protein n=1 Tax=Arcobacter aquimarinus TaxID=1315211 RepID=UPI003BB1546D
MALEIERKYLVNLEKLGTLENGNRIKQGYLSTNKDAVVRVRVKNDKAYLTIKGSNIGATRLEFEYKIPVVEANEMLDKLCQKPVIDKTRYLIDYENHTFELDIFYGDNDGLVVAEVELLDENETIKLPSWIKEEVTSDERYYNSNLMKNPYKNWKK